MRLRMYKNEEESLDPGFYMNNSNTRRKFNRILIILVLVLIWYSAAVVTITSTKVLMNAFQLPFLLCTVQFIFASILTSIYIRYTHPSSLGASHPPGVNMLVFQIAVSYTLGFILTNSAFSIVSAAFAETIKASEPISTVAIGLLFFNESVSLRTYATLVPICIGVGVSCYHDENFHFWGFTLAALSNLGFSSRAVFAKRLNILYPDNIDELNMFATISMQGLIILIPTTLLMEGNQILSIIDQSRNRGIANNTNLADLWKILLINGTFFAIYNLVSYVVLRRTDLITHSVLNAFRRVFIIVATTLYFHNILSSFNMIGIGTAIVGVILFALSRSLDKPKDES